MSNDDTQFAWWSRLRHSGLLLSPVVQIEKYAQEPEEPKWYQPDKLRTAHNRFVASIDRSKDRPQIAQSDILTWVDALLEKYIGHADQRMARSHSIPESLTAVVRIGSRTETLRPDRVLFAEDGKTPLLLVKADTSPHIGRGKGRTEYARFLELLRGCGHRIGLLTNGLQFRLVYAGLDFESWCEWESERWFEDAEGTEELLGLRQLLFPTQITDNKGEVIGAVCRVASCPACLRHRRIPQAASRPVGGAAGERASGGRDAAGRCLQRQPHRCRSVPRFDVAPKSI